MSEAEIDEALTNLRLMTYAERAANGCIGPERADLVLAGCAILEAIRRAFPAPRVRIADRGLREGILVQMMSATASGAASVRASSRHERDKGGGSSGHEGGRSLKVRVKTGAKRTMSSKLWLQRQLNDPYVAAAKREGWRSRAVYKLIELDERFHLLKPGQKIVDLGAAPGGWSQYAAKKIQSDTGKARSSASTCSISNHCGRQFHRDGLSRSRRAGKAERHARRRGGWRHVRHGGEHDRPQEDRSSAHRASGRSRDRVCPRSACARRVLHRETVSGGAEGELLTALKRDFAIVRHVKPKASRADSAELYVLATGFRGSRPEKAESEE